MEKKVIRKNDWYSSFNLVGKPRISEEYTFKIDEHSDKSNWIYNSMNIGIDCGEKNGVIYCEMMGGYSADGENVIYASSKDNPKEQIVVKWEDRFNDNVLEEIADFSFITVGIEKTNKGQTFFKKFLSAYDAIAYIKDYLTEDMEIHVRGNLKYSTYNDVTQVRRNITRIELAKVESNSDYKATFTQSVLIDKDSASLKDIDREKGTMYVNAKVLDYVKEINGIEVKGQYPFNKQFEYELNLENEKLCKLVYEKLFRVKRGVTQITFEGEFIEGGATKKATLDEIPEDIRELVEIGVYTEEEALAKCVVSGGRERRMVLKKPYTKPATEENPIAVVQKFEERYMEEDLILDYLNEVEDEVPFNENAESEDDPMDWISKL